MWFPGPAFPWVFLKGTAMRSVLCRVVPGLGFLLIFVLASPAGGGAAEIAQMGGGGPPSPEKMVQRMDENGDGKISRQEFLGPPDRFKMIDVDKDGFLTVDEIKAFRAKRLKGGGMGAAQGPAKGPGGEIFLTAAQVKLLISGTEITHTSPRSGNFVFMKFLADGTVDGNVGSGVIVNGTWQVRARGQLCFDVAVLGNELCFYLVRQGDNIVRYDRDGSPAKGIDWTIVKPGPDANKVP